MGIAQAGSSSSTLSAVTALGETEPGPSLCWLFPHHTEPPRSNLEAWGGRLWWPHMVEAQQPAMRW